MNISYVVGTAWVCLDCCNKVPQDWVASTTDIYFFQFWELGSPGSRRQLISFWWKLSSWCTDGCLFPVSSHIRERKWAHSLVSLLTRTLILLDYDSTHISSFKLNYLPIVPISKYSHTGGLRLQHMNRSRGNGLQSPAGAIRYNITLQNMHDSFGLEELKM